jgi:hypothetical protein
VEVDTAQRSLQDTSIGADRTASSVESGVQWEDQVTYVKEEPWTEDFHATWPGYSPNV